MAGATFERRCSLCGRAAGQSDRYCASCGTPLLNASLQVTNAPESSLSEQRKVATILFADLEASTPLGETRDPEETRVILTRFFDALARQVVRYNGTIDKFVGDAVMAVFGAPLSHEDDPERAIRTGLAMQAALVAVNDELERTHDLRLSLRVGIATGEVVAGMLAGNVQRAYTVVGDAVNAAFRLQSVCPPGEVIVDDMTRRLAREVFVFESLPAVSLKGKADPVVPFRVQRSRDDEVLPRLGRMVDAARERERLRSVLGEALLGHGGAIDITGEPGVGKSRLVLEFRRDLAVGVQRQIARCASYQMGTPYALFADLVRAFFVIHATDTAIVARDKLNAGFATSRLHLSPEILTLLLEILGYGARSLLAPELVRQLLVATARDLLLRTTEEAPLVMVVEDLQWIDQPSAALIREVVPDLGTLPIVLVTTSRSGTRMPWPSERIELAPLQDSDARELAHDLGGASIAEELLGRVLERTGGNPFFIEEVLREILHAKRTDVPATVQEVIEAHLDRLPPGSRRLVEVASVIGRSFWLPLLRRLVPRATLAEDIAVLEQEGLFVRRTIRPELTYAFRQPLQQEVAYQVQLLATRRALHGKVASALESLYAERLDEFTDALAYQWARSDNRAKALEWLVRAGNRARALYANDEALTAYTSALERAEDGVGPRDASTILEHIADVQLLVGRYDDAISACTNARERAVAADQTVHARLLRKIGSAHRWRAEYDPALNAFAEARALLGATSDAEAAQIALAEGMAYFHRGNYESARASLEDAVNVGRMRGVDDVMAEGLKILGNVENNLGHLPAAIEAYEQSLAIYLRLGDIKGIADLHSNLGNMYRRMARYEDALVEHRRSLAVRERIGHRWGVATCHNNIGEVFRSIGHPEQAIPEFERALETWESIRSKDGAGLARMNLGAARVEAKDVARGREDLRIAFGQLDGTKFLPSAYRELARAELAAGEFDAAQHHAEQARALAHGTGARQTEAQAERVLAEILLARGEEPKARQLLERSERTFKELGEITELARTNAVLAGVRR